MPRSLMETGWTQGIPECGTTDGIDRYSRTVSEIGTGTYSSVDLFRLNTGEHNSESDPLFAIKSISYTSLRSTQIPVYGPQGLTDVCSGVFQLDREHKILEQLCSFKCPHIISIHEILVEENMVHIVYPYRGYPIMTFCETIQAYSATTVDRVDHFRALPTAGSDAIHLLRIDDATECMRQLLSAVAIVHAADVCHKDIKPENVLIQAPFSQWWSRSVPESPTMFCDSPNPSQIHVTLCDFNTAEYMRDSGKIYDAQGTVIFSPPEVFNRAFTEDQTIDGSARDIWSVGLVGFALLCGTLPILGKTPLEIQLELIGMIHDMPEGHLSLPCDWLSIPNAAPIKAVIESMLSVNPQARPSASETLDSLT